MKPRKQKTKTTADLFIDAENIYNSETEKNNLTNYFHNKFKDEGKYIGKRFIKEIINHCQQRKKEKDEAQMKTFLESRSDELGVDKNVCIMPSEVDNHSADNSPQETPQKGQGSKSSTGILNEDTHDKPLDESAFDNIHFGKEVKFIYFDDVKQFLSKVLEDIKLISLIDENGIPVKGDSLIYLNVMKDIIKSIIKSRAGQSFFNDKRNLTLGEINDIYNNGKSVFKDGGEE